MNFLLPSLYICREGKKKEMRYIITSDYRTVVERVNLLPL